MTRHDELSGLPLARALVAAGVPEGDMAFGVPLASLSRWQIGGPADLLVTPSSVGSLQAAIGAINRLSARHLVIGDGSNILFDDAGVRGCVVRIGRALGGVRRVSPTEVEAGAGAWVPSLVRSAIGMGLGGIQHAIGIPGTFGGLVAMNGGSQRRGIGENLVHADVIDAGGRCQRLDADALAFRYRTSRLQHEPLVMIGGRLRLIEGDRSALRREAIAIMAGRRAKFPRNRANCGSVFVSDPALYDRIGPPGAAIEAAGLKGHRIGDAQVSPEHANFIVNLGGARSSDVLALIGLIRSRVTDMTGVAMLAEVRYVSPEGETLPAHEAAAAAASGQEVDGR